MKKLILKMSVSIDGFVGGPDGEIDWIFKSLDSDATAWTLQTLWQAGVHIMGSRTYRDMSAYWPSSTEPFAAPMNEIPKVVFSRQGHAASLSAGSTTTALRDATRARQPDAVQSSHIVAEKKAAWADSAIASGELAAEIARLKQQPGSDILAHGGARFAQNLVMQGLVDEYRLLVHPVALGSGLALFSALSRPIDLHPVSTKIFMSGAVAHVYRPG